MKKFLSPLILTVLIFLVYSNTWTHSFHFDDVPSILEKPWIRGLDKIPQFITSWGQRPLVILSFNLNYAISEFEVWSYHLFNIVFHVMATGLVFLLGRMGHAYVSHPEERIKTSRLPLLAALIFALHPLQTQSVTYISSRSSILATIFYLAALILFFTVSLQQKTPEEGTRSSTRFSKIAYVGGAIVFFILGLLTKLIIITLPAILFLLHYYFISSKNIRRWLVEQGKWILLVTVGLLSGVLYQHFRGGGLLKAQADAPSTASYFLTQTLAVPLEYFRKILFPFNLSIDSDFPPFEQWGSVTAWSGVLILLICVFVVVSFRKTSDAGGESYGFRRMQGFGMGWILITLLPTSSVIPLLDYSVEHRTYLPMVGFSILSSAMICELLYRFRKAGVGSRVFGVSSVPVTWGCTVLILILFSAGVVKRNEAWKSEVTLWADAKKKSPYVTRTYNNLGEAYDKLGEYDKAIAEFEAAIKLVPTYFFALNNLGNVYGKRKEFPKAIVYFERALAQKPDYAAAHYNMGKAQHMTGKPKEALESYRKAVRYNPYFEEAFFNLGFLALQMRLADESIENFLEFLKMQPRHPKARYGLGNAYAVKQQFDLAAAEYQKSIELDPSFMPPYVNLATIQWQTGKIDEALASYEHILSKNPESGGIHKNLGLIYSQVKKDPQKAAFHFQEYLRLMPHAPDAEAVRSAITDLTKIPK